MFVREKFLYFSLNYLFSHTHLEKLPSDQLQPVKISPKVLYTILSEQILDFARLVKVLFSIAHFFPFLA